MSSGISGLGQQHSPSYTGSYDYTTGSVEGQESGAPQANAHNSTEELKKALNSKLGADLISKAQGNISSSFKEGLSGGLQSGEVKLFNFAGNPSLASPDADSSLAALMAAMGNLTKEQMLQAIKQSLDGAKQSSKQASQQLDSANAGQTSANNQANEAYAKAAHAKLMKIVTLGASAILTAISIAIAVVTFGTATPLAVAALALTVTVATASFVLTATNAWGPNGWIQKDIEKHKQKELKKKYESEGMSPTAANNKAQVQAAKYAAGWGIAIAAIFVVLSIAAGGAGGAAAGGSNALALGVAGGVAAGAGSVASTGIVQNSMNLSHGVYDTDNPAEMKKREQALAKETMTITIILSVIAVAAAIGGGVAAARGGTAAAEGAEGAASAGTAASTATKAEVASEAAETTTAAKSAKETSSTGGSGAAAGGVGATSSDMMDTGSAAANTGKTAAKEAEKTAAAQAANSASGSGTGPKVAKPGEAPTATTAGAAKGASSGAKGADDTAEATAKNTQSFLEKMIRRFGDEDTPSEQINALAQKVAGRLQMVGAGTSISQAGVSTGSQIDQAHIQKSMDENATLQSFFSGVEQYWGQQSADLKEVFKQASEGLKTTNESFDKMMQDMTAAVQMIGTNRG